MKGLNWERYLVTFQDLLVLATTQLFLHWTRSHVSFIERPFNFTVNVTCVSITVDSSCYTVVYGESTVKKKCIGVSLERRKQHRTRKRNVVSRYIVYIFHISSYMSKRSYLRCYQINSMCSSRLPGNLWHPCQRTHLLNILLFYQQFQNRVRTTRVKKSTFKHVLSHSLVVLADGQPRRGLSVHRFQ